MDTPYNKEYDILKTLTPEEREATLSILNEFAKNGSSASYDKLEYADYKEIPVGITDFVLDTRYLGNAWHTTEGKSKLYPFWKDVLNKIFTDGVTTTVNNLIESGARGLGKSEVACTVIAYMMYRVMCLKDPNQHFNLKPTEKICFAFMNITKTLSEEVGVTKFQAMIQMSPWFQARCSMTSYNNKPYMIPPEPIRIIIGSQASHVIGQPIYAAFFDEISFVKNKDIDKQKAIAINMIDTAIGGMKTRFINKGKNPTLLILASSKRSDHSFLEEHMRKKLESEKDNVMIIDKAVWDVKPKGTYSDKTFKVGLGNKFLQSVIIPDNEDENKWVLKGYKILNVPIDFKSNFLEDIDRALCDYAGISSSEISKYIKGDAIASLIDRNISNPFTNDILEIGNAPDDLRQYYNFFDLTKIPEGYRSRPLYIHLDMSVDGDMTGIAVVWVTKKKVSSDSESQRNDLFYRLAFSTSIRAPKGRQISFAKNREFIYWLKDSGFNIKGVSTDSFQSVDTGQQLLAKKYPYVKLSVDIVSPDHICHPYQYLRSVIYEGRLQMFESHSLIDELVNLERNINTGKVDHPDGGRKDVADAVCGAVFNASQHAEEFAYDYGEEDLENTVDINNDTSADAKRQVTVAFEDELKKMGPQIQPPQEDKKQDNHVALKYMDDNVFIM